MIKKILAGVCCVIFLTFSPASFAESTTAPLPDWLNKIIAEQQNAEHPDKIEEGSYDGKRVFQFIHIDRADTGHEHVLLNEEGKEICQFGGYVGKVTSGSCNIQKIEYVRTVFPEKTTHPSP